MHRRFTRFLVCSGPSPLSHSLSRSPTGPLASFELRHSPVVRCSVTQALPPKPRRASVCARSNARTRLTPAPLPSSLTFVRSAAPALFILDMQSTSPFAFAGHGPAAPVRSRTFLRRSELSPRRSGCAPDVLTPPPMPHSHAFVPLPRFTYSLGLRPPLIMLDPHRLSLAFAAVSPTAPTRSRPLPSSGRACASPVRLCPRRSRTSRRCLTHFRSFPSLRSSRCSGCATAQHKM